MTAPVTLRTCEMLASPRAPGYSVRRMAATQITWRDALEMPEDGKRHEAIGGELWGTPCPPTRHWLVCGGLAVALFDLLDRPGHGTILPGVGVEFSDGAEGVIRGAPDLIEVWRFAAGAVEPERHTDRVPVRLGDRVVGEMSWLGSSTGRAVSPTAHPPHTRERLAAGSGPCPRGAASIPLCPPGYRVSRHLRSLRR